MEIVICLCAAPDPRSARKLSRHWLKQGWAACINEMPHIISRYYWEDELKEEREHLLIIKTTPDGAQKIKDDLDDTHPYDCPEWVEFNAQSTQQYGDWVSEMVNLMTK